MASTKQWMRFFLGAGIPPDSAAHYAVSFEQNRMGLDMLLELDKEYLRWAGCENCAQLFGVQHILQEHGDLHQVKKFCRM